MKNGEGLRLAGRAEAGVSNEEARECRNFSTGISEKAWRHERPGGYLFTVSSDRVGPRTPQQRSVRIETTARETKSPPATTRM